jgi:transcriptional regulator with XRE-family HTH domain
MKEPLFVNVLEKLLRNKGLTISDLASYIGEKPETIYEGWVMDGHLPSKEIVYKICSVFDVSLENFLEPDIIGESAWMLFTPFSVNKTRLK